MRLLTHFLLICAVCFVGACSPQSAIPGDGRAAVSAAQRNSSPETVAEHFMAAASTQDVESFKENLTMAAVQGLESDSGFDLSSGAIDSYTVGTAVVDGENARVPVDAVMGGSDQLVTLEMRSEQDAWKVYAMTISFSEDSEMTINLEKLGGMLESMVDEIGESFQTSIQSAFEESFRGGSADEIAKKKASYDALRAITTSEYESGWLNTTEYRGAVAGEALRALTRELGLGFDSRGHEAALARVVSTNVAGLSRLEAIERICAEAKVYPVYPPADPSFGGLGGAMLNALVDGISTAFDSENSALKIKGDANFSQQEEIPNAVTLEQGPRRWPVAFSGPYLIAVETLEENAPHATGRVGITTRAYGLEEGVLGLQESTNESISISGITDAQERNLNAEENVTYWGGGLTSGTAFQESTHIDLKNLLRDVETIDRLAGERKLMLPTNVDTLRFGKLIEGTSLGAGDVRVTVKKVAIQISFDVTGPEEQLTGLMARFWAWDASGNDLGITYASLDHWSGDKAQASVQTHEPASTIEIKLISTHDSLVYPFELRAIPLEKYAQMPEKIEALAFEGHDAPIEIAFVYFKDRSDPDFPTVTLQAKNHSNKDALTVHATFVYIDGKGAELKDFPHTLQGAFSADGFAMVVGSAGTEELEATAFFMPVETNRVRAKVESVEFIDGSVWERKS